MDVKISYDEGASFGDPVDLDTCFPDRDDDPEYLECVRALRRLGRYWLGGGAAPLTLLVRA